MATTEDHGTKPENGPYLSKNDDKIVLALCLFLTLMALSIFICELIHDIYTVECMISIINLIRLQNSQNHSNDSDLDTFEQSTDTNINLELCLFGDKVIEPVNNPAAMLMESLLTIFSAVFWLIMQIIILERNCEIIREGILSLKFFFKAILIAPFAYTVSVLYYILNHDEFYALCIPIQFFEVFLLCLLHSKTINFTNEEENTLGLHDNIIVLCAHYKYKKKTVIVVTYFATVVFLGLKFYLEFIAELTFQMVLPLYSAYLPNDIHEFKQVITHILLALFSFWKFMLGNYLFDQLYQRYERNRKKREDVESGEVSLTQEEGQVNREESNLRKAQGSPPHEEGQVNHEEFNQGEGQGSECRECPIQEEDRRSYAESNPEESQGSYEESNTGEDQGSPTQEEPQGRQEDSSPAESQGSQEVSIPAEGRGSPTQESYEEFNSEREKRESHLSGGSEGASPQGEGHSV